MVSVAFSVHHELEHLVISYARQQQESPQLDARQNKRKPFLTGHKYILAILVFNSISLGG